MLYDDIYNLTKKHFFDINCSNCRNKNKGSCTFCIMYQNKGHFLWRIREDFNHEFTQKLIKIIKEYDQK